MPLQFSAATAETMVVRLCKPVFGMLAICYKKNAFASQINHLLAWPKKEVNKFRTNLLRRNAVTRTRTINYSTINYSAIKHNVTSGNTVLIACCAKTVPGGRVRLINSWLYFIV